MKEKVKGLFKRLRQARGPKKPRKMSRKKKLLTAAAGLILFLALITAAVRQNKASAVKAQSQRVNTATVIRQNITSTLSLLRYNLTEGYVQHYLYVGRGGGAGRL